MNHVISMRQVAVAEVAGAKELDVTELAVAMGAIWGFKLVGAVLKRRGV